MVGLWINNEGCINTTRSRYQYIKCREGFFCIYTDPKNMYIKEAFIRGEIYIAENRVAFRI